LNQTFTIIKKVLIYIAREVRDGRLKLDKIVGNALGSEYPTSVYQTDQ
jgi:hypothetical protein